MAKEYFNKTQTMNINQMNTEDKARVWLDKLLSGKIDLKTYKSGLDVLLPNQQKYDEYIGYI